jgi:hypothetical protein
MPLLADPTPEEIITRSLKNLEQVASISFSCNRGNESYTLNELPPFYEVHYRSINKQKNYLFEWLAGFGAMGGYRLSFTTGQMELQKAGFDDFAHHLISKNWTPLDVYDFVLTPKDKGKSLRLAQLKEPTAAKSAAARAVAVNSDGPNENPGIICLDFKGCYDSRLEKTVGMRVYFSVANDFFPFAWEKRDEHGKGLLAYSAETLYRQGDVCLVREFRLRNLEACQANGIKASESTFIKGVDEIYEFSNLQINTLHKEDFDPDPSKAESVVDLDADTVIKIPR